MNIVFRVTRNALAAVGALAVTFFVVAWKTAGKWMDQPEAIPPAVEEQIHGPHLIQFEYDRFDVLRHPADCDRQNCAAVRQAESMRLCNGQMQVQGLYVSTASGLGYERV